MTADPPARRRRDPERRIAEITAATERVIAGRGIEGLTHRAVADEAGVPLGATTYHFATKDDLILAALRRAYERYAAMLEEWVAQRPELTTNQLVVLLTDALMGCYGPHRDREVVQMELYLAALRRPALRPIADLYTEATMNALLPYVDRPTARAATAAMNGLTMSGLAASLPPGRAEVEDVLRRVLTPNPALPDATEA
ncbi:TetR family transcriptional regulator [Streptomyces sp. HU2014]|uniref:Transcriptional regulator n=1 Tax=Streptomyces albireticuli TaxID=1940 RepID=A0A1Z2L2T1_9ACTN|nr:MULTISPECIES: TetR family transcriptional regulator [Streptomyces]ARZ68600.1 transcriptional regulator [Streptomyces albireticuli]UQI48532.1 TetR family transcriptional regulator [Streptomyces sp. HU2014]